MYSAERIGIEEFPRGPVDYDDFGRSCLVRHDGKEWGMGTFYACFNVTRELATPLHHPVQISIGLARPGREKWEGK